MIPTPQEWHDAMSVTRSVSEQRMFAVKHVRTLLTKGAMVDCSTTVLCETLWPASSATSASASAARKRMIDHILKAARHELSDCAHQGASVRKLYGREVHPWLWNRPGVVANTSTVLECCPHCGGQLNASQQKDTAP